MNYKAEGRSVFILRMQMMAFLMPGAFCDMHVAVLDKMDHTIATTTKARVAFLHRARLEALINATPAITHALWRAELIDEPTVRAWIVSMGRRGSTERVAHLICEPLRSRKPPIC